MQCPQETISMPAIVRARHTDSMKSVARVTEPMLPIDDDNRPYLCSSVTWDGKCSLWDDTVCHVERLCEKYHTVMGHYPSVIYLSAHRYLAAQARVYWPRDMTRKKIPYEWKMGTHFEILVR